MLYLGQKKKPSHIRPKMLGKAEDALNIYFYTSYYIEI